MRHGTRALFPLLLALAAASPAASGGQFQHCQLPNQAQNGGAGAIAATSDANPVVNSVAQEVIPAPASATNLAQVTWWGTYLDNTGFANCGPPADAFSITYHADSLAGFPGAIVAGPFAVSATRTATGLTIPWPQGPATEYEYTATHPPVPHAGARLWIQIANATTGNCVFRWTTSPAGDGIITFIDASGLNLASTDLAFCVESGATEPGGPTCECSDGAPCGNTGGAGTGCQNSTGLGALLTASGNATIGADTVVLHASQCPPSVPGLFFSGPQSALVPLADGKLCVGGSILRIEVVVTDAAGSASSSTVLSTFEGLSGGETRFYQYWVRDVTGPCGNGSNTSNGYRISW